MGQAIALAIPSLISLIPYFVDIINKNIVPTSQPNTPDEVAEFPRPEWLPSDGINWAVVGWTGVGKSSFINAVRGVRPNPLNPEDPNVAVVGFTEQTTSPRPYAFPSHPNVKLWDLPGGGTTRFPKEHYLYQFGLRYFHGIIIITGDRWVELDRDILDLASQFQIPYYVVRSKVDRTLEDGAQDHGLSEDQVLKRLRLELSTHIHSANPQFSASKLYLISSRVQTLADWPKFYQDVFSDLQSMTSTSC